jgi:hypothetical protein
MDDSASTYTMDKALFSMEFGKFHTFVLAYARTAKTSEAISPTLLGA